MLGILRESKWRGPTVYSGGRIRDNASRTCASNSSKVFIMIAEARKDCCISPLTNLMPNSSGFVVRIKVGKSLSLMLFIPGIQSMTVSRYPLVRSSSPETRAKNKRFSYKRNLKRNCILIERRAEVHSKTFAMNYHNSHAVHFVASLCDKLEIMW